MRMLNSHGNEIARKKPTLQCQKQAKLLPSCTSLLGDFYAFIALSSMVTFSLPSFFPKSYTVRINSYVEVEVIVENP